MQWDALYNSEMGILNIFIDPSSRGNRSDGDFLELKKSFRKREKIYITPIRHLYEVFSIKVLQKKVDIPRAELRTHSKQANVRCIDCGWKYNFHSINQCPVCTSDKTYLLSNGSFLASVATISLIVAAFCGLIVIAYRTITG